MKNGSMSRRILALALVLALIVSVLPAAVFAEDGAEGSDYVLESKSLTAFAANAKADGEIEKINDTFSIVWSAKSKVDSSAKTWDDGYESGQRISFGGKAATDKNSIRISLDGPATVTIWWVQGGDDNREMVILDADGQQAAINGGITRNPDGTVNMNGYLELTDKAPAENVGARFPAYVAPVENPFEDVETDAYYFDAVLWAVENEITTGTSATTFSPKDTCTRGQVITFLWRAQGSPAPKSTENPFVDVKEGQFFYEAVLWAVESGITSGTDAAHFSPKADCTRGHVVTFLWRAKGEPAPAQTENPFQDVAEGKFYYNAVLWAVEQGITTGTSAATFKPGSSCTRAQVVTFLFREANPA